MGIQQLLMLVLVRVLVLMVVVVLVYHRLLGLRACYMMLVATVGRGHGSIVLAIVGH